MKGKRKKRVENMGQVQGHLLERDQHPEKVLIESDRKQDWMIITQRITNR
jgi:hypothetical protein